MNSMKEEIREVKLENQELRRSLEFNQGKLRDAEGVRICVSTKKKLTFYLSACV